MILLLKCSCLEFPTDQKEKDSQKELEREAARKHSSEELEAKNKEIMLLEKQIKELEQKLQLADSKLLQKVCFYSTYNSHQNKKF